MATVSTFANFYLELAKGTHNFSSHTFKMALTNTAPVTATDDHFADITELAAGNGYTAGGATVTVSSVTLASSVCQIVFATTTITASGGSIGPFRYLVIYNDTAANDELVMSIDLGSELTVPDTENVSMLTNSAGNLRIKVD